MNRNTPLKAAAITGAIALTAILTHGLARDYDTFWGAFSALMTISAMALSLMGTPPAALIATRGITTSAQWSRKLLIATAMAFPILIAITALIAMVSHLTDSLEGLLEAMGILFIPATFLVHLFLSPYLYLKNAGALKPDRQAYWTSIGAGGAITLTAVTAGTIMAANLYKESQEYMFTALLVPMLAAIAYHTIFLPLITIKATREYSQKPTE